MLDPFRSPLDLGLLEMLVLHGGESNAETDATIVSSKKALILR